MDELVFSGELLESTPSSPFLMADVTEVDSEGISISVNGGVEQLKKKYKCVQTGQQVSKGDRVLVAKVSGTYVILGKISM